jgi:hypothetical protein
MAWQNIILDYGDDGCFTREVHTTPVCDSRIHTVPMCWCRPVAKSTGRGSHTYSHNAVSVPD